MKSMLPLRPTPTPSCEGSIGSFFFFFDALTLTVGLGSVWARQHSGGAILQTPPSARVPIVSQNLHARGLSVRASCPDAASARRRQCVWTRSSVYAGVRLRWALRWSALWLAQSA